MSTSRRFNPKRALLLLFAGLGFAAFLIFAVAGWEQNQATRKWKAAMALNSEGQTVTRHNFPSHRAFFFSDSIRADKKAL